MPLMSRLQNTIERLVERAGCEAGIAVRHVERDERLEINGAQRFPACSVFKVPVLVEAFRQAAAGEFSLLNRWQLSNDDKSVGSGVLQILDQGLAPTVHDLLTLMIVISDNTAADILTRRLQPEKITATMQSLDLHDTWVTITCSEMIGTAFGPGDPKLLPWQRARLIGEHPPAPESAVYHDGADNDVTTANDMVDLFTCIQTGERMDRIGLTEADRDGMLSILYRQQVNERLPRYLPPTLPFAHKTGSMSGAFELHNDAGILELDGGEHLAIAAFTRARSPQPGDPRALPALRHRMDDLIAEIGLAAYQHYAAVTV